MKLLLRSCLLHRWLVQPTLVFWRWILVVGLLAVGASQSSIRASDHADPMSLNPFKLQDDPDANITDLHAFVVDTNGTPVLDPARIAEADQLIISLCVHRRLLPRQHAALANTLTNYSFRVHLDLNPTIRFFDPTKTRDGHAYAAVLADYDVRIAKAVSDREAAKAARPIGDITPSKAEMDADMAWNKLVTARGEIVQQQQSDESAQRLYGGIIDTSSTIADDAILDFHLNFASDGENSQATLAGYRIDGISGAVNMVSEERKSLDGKRTLVEKRPMVKGAINVQTGIFDDPFIFPRFFRANVVGIVTSIPLRMIHRHDGSAITEGPILLWATTHVPGGAQSDHVGRSLRTQLPRFGYLNTVHPSQHVAEIMQVHAQPGLLDNILAVMLAPLEAHRHYDNAPDVMVYDLRRPARFPNGRWLEDDVAKTLADAGETLLLELSYAESRQFPRAETNDKPFRKQFPYLAPAWTTQETSEHAAPGTSWENGFKIPTAGDSDATGVPDLTPAVWKSLWLGLLLGVIGSGLLAFLAVRHVPTKIVILAAGIMGCMVLAPIRAENLAPRDPARPAQPQVRLIRVIEAGGFIGVFSIVALYSVGVRRGLRVAALETVNPLGDQGLTPEDRQYSGSSFQEVRDAVFSNPYYVGAWGQTSQQPLPVYPSQFWSVATGLFSLSKRFFFLDAAQRTLESRADLRWGGPDRKGFLRLIHRNGVCLTGTWNITEETGYTGYFSKGSRGLVIARYSSGLSVYRGEARTLSMVGKLYPGTDKLLKCRPAAFVTQEVLGGSFTPSIRDSLLRNAPDVQPLQSGLGLGTFLLTAFTFFRADRRISIRQLYEIAELGKPAASSTVCPTYMQLSVTGPKVSEDDDTSDFRDEVLAHIYEPGTGRKAGKLVFQIQVSDTGTVKGFFNKTIKDANWRTIGTISFDEAVASYNGDRVIHFHHPKWRKAQNDPQSEVGPIWLARVINTFSTNWQALLALLAGKR